MQAGDEGKSGSAGGQDGQGGSGASDRQGGPEGSAGSGGPRGSGSAGAGGSASGSAPPVAYTSGAPASSINQGSRRQVHAFAIRVTFPSHMVAEIARRSLAPFEGRHLLGVPRELTVTGNILVVWITANRGRFQYAFAYFLEQLYLVVQTMKRHGLLFPTKSLPGKGV